uniref:Uncharacterized protein n=1 Tax=Ganoderma boninense TaxID=34458 RepID=A0A5K1JSE9_9APHY|nr:Uncharacterized protein [Ganoderma boninense]
MIPNTNSPGTMFSIPRAQDAPHALGGQLAEQFSWNYDHVSSLWEYEGWIPQSAVDLARSHYAAYMVRRNDGLRVITLNTDLWYTCVYFTDLRRYLIIANNNEQRELL